VVRYRAETSEAFRDGHVRAFSFFGGVPQSILYDNTKIAVTRRRTYLRLQSFPF
jgi:transposase